MQSGSSSQRLFTPKLPCRIQTFFVSTRLSPHLRYHFTDTVLYYPPFSQRDKRELNPSTQSEEKPVENPSPTASNDFISLSPTPSIASESVEPIYDQVVHILSSIPSEEKTIRIELRVFLLLFHFKRIETVSSVTNGLPSQSDFCCDSALGRKQTRFDHLDPVYQTLFQSSDRFPYSHVHSNTKGNPPWKPF